MSLAANFLVLKSRGLIWKLSPAKVILGMYESAVSQGNILQRKQGQFSGWTRWNEMEYRLTRDR
jgi:hypothetical protein